MEGVNIDKMEDAVLVLSRLAIQYGLKLLLAVAILIIGFWLVKKIVKSFRKLMQIRQVEPSLLSFLSSLISAILKILVVVIVLTTVGVEMTSIVAILGAMSLAVGMALSGTLQNFAGGVVILLFKPFKIGDYVETQSGYSGTVQGISIFTTALKTVENKIVYLPNGALSNGVIINVNEEGKRRIDCTFGIAYGDDINKARQILLNLLNKDARVHKIPEPTVHLDSLADNSVNVLVRFWANSGDVFALQCDLNEKVYEEFTRHELNFPFPQMDVHMMTQ